MTSAVPSDRPVSKPTPTPTPTPQPAGQPVPAGQAMPTGQPVPSGQAPANQPPTTGAGSQQSQDRGKDRKRDAVTGGLYGSDLAGNLTRATVAEAVGTYLLVLAGTAVAVAAGLSKGGFDGLAPAIAFGLMLAALATALGHISGAHLNPAVTLGLAATRKFPIAYIPAYLIAQVGGAVLASLTVWGAFGDRGRTVGLLGTPGPSDGVTLLRAGLVEAVITFLLMLVIVSVATDDRVPPAAAGLAVGFALFAAVAVGGTITGGSVNPARAIGPMLVSGHFPMWGMYLLAPVIGAVVAAVLYDRVLSKGEQPEA